VVSLQELTDPISVPAREAMDRATWCKRGKEDGTLWRPLEDGGEGVDRRVHGDHGFLEQRAPAPGPTPLFPGRRARCSSGSSAVSFRDDLRTEAGPARCLCLPPPRRGPNQCRSTSD